MVGSRYTTYFYGPPTLGSLFKSALDWMTTAAICVIWPTGGVEGAGVGGGRRTGQHTKSLRTHSPLPLSSHFQGHHSTLIGFLIPENPVVNYGVVFTQPITNLMVEETVFSRAFFSPILASPLFLETSLFCRQRRRRVERWRSSDFGRRTAKRFTLQEGCQTTWFSQCTNHIEYN